ncbi:ACT domain-containing protein [Methanonatronarchaeum sp. AMET6-2]|uniref:ACT domain-containing protein n=1 Tax=Methanonatronarchaeum sp. AMET6-2 TaxID=2933293 RepID=UPI00120D409E|nr:ACT domain-containing protein [Methanonatronarchaeum sp. AMET6-2]RZN63487.1 MAG: ACT domain-containing protein [Methanonatronarchaeia archaeon]UOY09730.1 ACT domain-containing protein [Methanonatronarchaeum sp. AMET6-2]
MDEDEVVVITVEGSDHPGIVAAITQALADVNANILDISQTVVREVFTMLLFADLENSDIDFAELKEKLDEVGEEQGVRITVQSEEIFRQMHRV